MSRTTANMNTAAHKTSEKHKTRDTATPNEQEQHSLRKRISTRKENQHRLNSAQNKYAQINTLNNKQSGTTAQYTQTETRPPEIVK